jgi:hypothetical protein
MEKAISDLIGSKRKKDGVVLVTYRINYTFRSDM